MSSLRKNRSYEFFRTNNLLLSNENDDIKYYLMHQTIKKAIESKLKQSHIKGYIDLSNIGLDSLPDEIFKLNYHSADGIKWWTNVDFTKIDLSYNNLSEKNSYDFRNIPHARVLYLISNKFNSIPLYLYYLKDLVFLDMSNNRLTHIEDNFFWNLSGLKTLNLSGNFIKYIPRSIRYMRHLIELNLSKNDLTSIPSEFMYLKYLKKFDISWNKIQIIDPHIFNNLSYLEELYCNDNILTNLENINNYRVFDSILNLKILDLSHNQYQDFLVFNQLYKLEKLNVSYNRLRNIFGLDICENLTEIDCSNNIFKEVPYCFLLLKNLHTLYLQWNELNNLPTLFCLMDTLSVLRIEGNPLKDFPSLKYADTFQIKQLLRFRLSEKDVYSIPQNLKYNYFNKLNDVNIMITKNYPYIHKSISNYIKNDTELIIKNLGLREIPFDSIKYNIPENFLTAINFSENRIDKGLDKFRSIIHLLQNVKLIDLSRNNIRFFPVVLLSLPFLEELFLSKNLMSYFPSKSLVENTPTNITQSLLVLDLSDNQLEEFPIIIEFFKKLKSLNLSGNNIKSIESLLYMRLEFLERFFLDNNRIEELPKNILFRAIPNVQSLTIANNYLTDIPTDISLLMFLVNIDFTGNYISKIPFECLINADQLKKYLKKDHIYSDEQKLFESKQEDKLRKSWEYFKEKERMFKTGPNYHRRVNQLFFNNFENYNYNDINRSYYETNYYDKVPFFSYYKKYGNLNKYKFSKYRTDSFERDLADINDDIYEVESKMKNKRLDPYNKANLKKKFINLIMERSDLYK